MGLFLVTRTRTWLNLDLVTHGFFHVGVRVVTGPEKKLLIEYFTTLFYPSLPQTPLLYLREHLEEVMQQAHQNHEYIHVNSSFRHTIGPVLIEQRGSYGHKAK